MVAFRRIFYFDQRKIRAKRIFKRSENVLFEQKTAMLANLGEGTSLARVEAHYRPIVREAREVRLVRSLFPQDTCRGLLFRRLLE